MPTKQCKTCFCFKEIPDYFNADEKYKDGFKPNCIFCEGIVNDEKRIKKEAAKYRYNKTKKKMKKASKDLDIWMINDNAIYM